MTLPNLYVIHIINQILYGIIQMREELVARDSFDLPDGVHIKILRSVPIRISADEATPLGRIPFCT